MTKKNYIAPLTTVVSVRFERHLLGLSEDTSLSPRYGGDDDGEGEGE